MIARRLEGWVRETDTVGRMVGDVFAVFLARCHRKDRPGPPRH